MNKPSSYQSNVLIDELIQIKNKAFAKLSHALTTDETSECFDEKIAVYKCSLTLIEEALKFYQRNAEHFIERQYADQIQRQLNDIKMKTIIRLNDLYELNSKTYKQIIVEPSNGQINSKFLPSCLNAPSELLDSSINKRKSKPDKSQISLPFDFKLVQHVGLTKNRFDIQLSSGDEFSMKMRQLLRELNVPFNKKTAVFVENYVKDHGGIERFSEEINKPKTPLIKALSFKNKFHNFSRENLIGVLDNQQEQRNSFIESSKIEVPPRPSKPLPPRSPTPPPFPLQPRNSCRNSSKHYENQSASLEFELLPYESTPEPPLNASPRTGITQQLPVNNVSIQQKSFIPPPPPPPLPPPKLNNNQTNLVRVQSTDSDRPSLMDSIRSFGGFQNKSSPQYQPEKRNSETNSLQLGSTSSIVDQLKSELAKRSQFLNDSSDTDDTEGVDEWQ